MRGLKCEIQQDTTFDDVVLFGLQYVNLDNIHYIYIGYSTMRGIMINVELNLNYDHMMDRRCRVIEFPIFIIIQKT